MRRHEELAVVLNGAWVSSRDLERLLRWAGPNGEPMTGPPFAQALSAAARILLASGLFEHKYGPLPGCPRVAFYRRKPAASKTNKRAANGFA